MNPVVPEVGKRPFWRRTNYIINPRFQWSVVGYALLAAFLVIGVVYCADLYFVYRFVSLGKSLGLPENHVYFSFLREQSYFMNKVFGFAAAGVIALLTAGGILVSHRIAGPLYKLRKHMRSVSDGQTLESVRFRKGDYFPELAEEYNRQLAYFKGRSEPEREITPIRRKGA